MHEGRRGSQPRHLGETARQYHVLRPADPLLADQIEHAQVLLVKHPFAHQKCDFVRTEVFPEGDWKPRIDETADHERTRTVARQRPLAAGLCGHLEYAGLSVCGQQLEGGQVDQVHAERGFQEPLHQSVRSPVEALVDELTRPGRIVAQFAIPDGVSHILQALETRGVDAFEDAPILSIVAGQLVEARPLCLSQLNRLAGHQSQ